MGTAGGLGSRLRTRFAAVADRRRTLRRRLVGIGRDAVVAVVLLALVAVVVGVAASVLGLAVSNGGLAGVVLGWPAAFAVAISLPVVAMKDATAVYERIGG